MHHPSKTEHLIRQLTYRPSFIPTQLYQIILHRLHQARRPAKQCLCFCTWLWELQLDHLLRHKSFTVLPVSRRPRKYMMDFKILWIFGCEFIQLVSEENVFFSVVAVKERDVGCVCGVFADSSDELFLTLVIESRDWE
jgi:hypothetical protein